MEKIDLSHITPKLRKKMKKGMSKREQDEAVRNFIENTRVSMDWLKQLDESRHLIQLLPPAMQEELNSLGSGLLINCRVEKLFN